MFPSSECLCVIGVLQWPIVKRTLLSFMRQQNSIPQLVFEVATSTSTLFRRYRLTCRTIIKFESVAWIVYYSGLCLRVELCIIVAIFSVPYMHPAMYSQLYRKRPFTHHTGSCLHPCLAKIMYWIWYMNNTKNIIRPIFGSHGIDLSWNDEVLINFNCNIIDFIDL